MSADARSPEALTPPAAVIARKPRFALFVATAAGLGYLPKAPGTWGSLAGLVLALCPWWIANLAVTSYIVAKHGDASYFVSEGSGRFLNDPFLCAQIALAVLTAVIGVGSANRAAQFWQIKDPQRVVIDEVSGQHLALLLGCGIPVWWRAVKFPWDSFPVGLISFRSALSWKYLLLGFILFRVFDIWKPFPARQAESLPGGWGIMADDWVAGIYAEILLWIARAAGL